MNFQYKISEKQKVKISLFDVLGREIVLLNEEQNEGEHVLNINLDEKCRHLLSGNFFIYVVQSKFLNESGKLLVIDGN